MAARYYAPNTRKDAQRLENNLHILFCLQDQREARNEIESYLTYYDFTADSEIETYTDLEEAVDSLFQSIAENLCDRIERSESTTLEAVKAFLWDKTFFDRMVDDAQQALREGSAYNRSPSAYYGVNNSDF
jgi:hypothetical protein